MLPVEFSEDEAEMADPLKKNDVFTVELMGRDMAFGWPTNGEWPVMSEEALLLDNELLEDIELKEWAAFGS